MGWCLSNTGNGMRPLAFIRMAYYLPIYLSWLIHIVNVQIHGFYFLWISLYVSFRVLFHLCFLLTSYRQGATIDALWHHHT